MKSRMDILFTSLCTTWSALLAILLVVWMDTYLLHYFHHGKYALCGLLGYFTQPSDQLSSTIPNTVMDDLSVLSHFHSVSIVYAQFEIREPLFIDQDDRSSFLVQRQNIATLGARSDTVLRGRIITHVNGTVHTSHDCGWNMNVGEFLRPIPKRRNPRHSFALLCPLLVPDSNTFQHFVDGVLPKLAQIHEIITHTQINITYLFYRPRDKIIHEMLDKIGIPPDRIAFYDGGYLSAKLLLNTCVTPPIHPTLWKTSRNLLRVDDRLKEPGKNTLVILLTRSNSRNIGRRILNMADTTSFLRRKYGSDLHIFQGGHTLAEAMSIFSKAAIVIGTHGGAFYNLIFCPASTKVIEILPVNEEGSPVPDHVAHTIIWQMAEVMNQTYLRLSQRAHNDKGDVYLPRDRLLRALHVLDETQRAKQIHA